MWVYLAYNVNNSKSFGEYRKNSPAINLIKEWLGEKKNITGGSVDVIYVSRLCNGKSDDGAY